MKYKGVLTLLSLMFQLNILKAQNIESFNTYLDGCEQVVFVSAPTWYSQAGVLKLYERSSDTSFWQCVHTCDIMLGKNGLAKDAFTVIPFKNESEIKKEGDGNSPAGIFSFEFIFSSHTISNLEFPFQRMDSNAICVDDIYSQYYNQYIQKENITNKDFQSYELMQRKDELYEYGIWVNYNSNPALSGNGSCIFLHIWQGPGIYTSGCTAMSKEDILYLIHWLSSEKHPKLLQIVNEEN